MKNLMETIRTMYEAPEDMQPASPDEGKMAYAQCEFIEYASEEICDYIENGGNFPEWFQNKLTKAHEVMKDLHSYMEGEKRASGTGQDPEEMDESTDLEEKKTLAASVLDTVNRAMDADDMDPVNPKALKKDFKDRKDKDIDNDGDVDKSDKYLHNRRKTVSKKIKATEAERNWKSKKEGKEKIDVKPKLEEESLKEEDHIGKMEYHERQAQKTTGAEQKKHMEKAKEHRRKAEFAMRGGSAHSYKEEFDIYEAVTVKLRGGKVPVGQHKFIYKVDKSPKYIENSIKERDKNAKVEVKGKDVHVTASAGAHSSFIDSLRKFRANGTVTEEIQMDDMQEGTMSRYELIKKAAQKVNKGEKKAMSDAQKAAKKDKDLRKPKVDSADVDESVEITEGNAAMELKKYANSKGGIDKQDFIAIANMIAKKKSAKELAMVLQVQDTDPRDKALQIISKNDNKLYHEILKAARGMKPAKNIKKPDPKKLMAQYEEVELEEDYKQDAKNAPFDADPEKKKKQKNSDGTETKPMSKAKQLAKKGLVSEAEMTPAQKRKKEEIVKGMKDKKDYFERKYGDRAKDVMYATATKMAMKEGFELSEETLKEFSVHTYKANQSSKKVATTKNGTNYVDGKAVGPVSDPDGGSASTPTRYSPPTKNGVTPPTRATKEDAAYDAKVAATSKAYVDKKAAPDSIAAPINKVRSAMKGSSEKKAMSAYNKVFGKK